MIERALYGEVWDPDFQVSQLVDRLSWLPEVLAASEPTPTYPNPSSFRVLLDTILVFSGTRTAAVHTLTCVDVCRDLVNKLNATLDESKFEFRCCHLEIVYRGPSQFFITRTFSPRFDWSLRLTHLEVGRNLDLFAAGHIFGTPFPDRGQINFVERNTMTLMSAEVFLLESARNIDFYNELVSFNNQKEALMNEMMEKLGLKYRVKWVLNTPEERELVKVIMQQSVPPNDEWWEKYCYLINCPIAPDDRPSLSFCRYNTRFREHWPLLQFLYSFNLKYVRYQYYHINDFCGFDYWATVKEIFAEVNWTLATELDLQEATKYCEKIKSKLNPLAMTGDAFLAGSVSQRQSTLHQPTKTFWVMKFPPIDILPNISYWGWMILEMAKISLFQRWKLRKPRIRLGPALPAGAIGQSYWM